MKKFTLTLILALLCVVTAGCDKDKVDVDVQKLGDNLTQKIKFEDQLTQIDEDIAKDIYEINFEKVKATAFIGSGATSEELVIFEAESKDKAKQILNLAKKHIEEQKQDYESYNPKEIKKLDNAIVIQKDKYVIICVTQDVNAEKIVNNSLK